MERIQEMSSRSKEHSVVSGNGSYCKKIRISFSRKAFANNRGIVLKLSLVLCLTTILSTSIVCDQHLDFKQNKSSTINSNKVINDRLASLDELLNLFHASSKPSNTSDHSFKETADHKQLEPRKNILPLNESESQQMQENRGEAKGSFLSSMASVVALNMMKRRCCAMRLCPCRFPGVIGPGGGVFPPNGGPGGGFYPGVGFPGFFPGMRPGYGGGGGGGSGGGDNEELQEGFDESGYSIRPNGRPKRRRPIYTNARPVGFRPGSVNGMKWSASGSSPESGFDHPEETTGLENIPGGMFTASASNSQTASPNQHQVSHGNMEGQSSAPGESMATNVGRKLLSVEHKECCSDESMTWKPHRVKRSPSSSVSSSLSSRRRHSSSSSNRERDSTRVDSHRSNVNNNKRRTTVTADSVQGTSVGSGVGRAVKTNKVSRRGSNQSNSQGVNNNQNTRSSKRSSKVSSEGSGSTSISPSSSSSGSSGSSQSFGSKTRIRTQRTSG